MSYTAIIVVDSQDLEHAESELLIHNHGDLFVAVLRARLIVDKWNRTVGWMNIVSITGMFCRSAPLVWYAEENMSRN